MARGKKLPEARRNIGVTEQTYYRWKNKYGGLRVDQAKRLKELDKENARLKRLLADAELDKAILKEVALGAARSSTSKILWDVTGCRNVGPVASWTRCSTQRRIRHMPEDEPR